MVKVTISGQKTTLTQYIEHGEKAILFKHTIRAYENMTTIKKNQMGGHGNRCIVSLKQQPMDNVYMGGTRYNRTQYYPYRVPLNV